MNVCFWILPLIFDCWDGSLGNFCRLFLINNNSICSFPIIIAAYWRYFLLIINERIKIILVKPMLFPPLIYIAAHKNMYKLSGLSWLFSNIKTKIYVLICFIVLTWCLLDIPINHHLDVLYIDTIEVFIIIFYQAFFSLKKKVNVTNKREN